MVFARSTRKSHKTKCVVFIMLTEAYNKLLAQLSDEQDMELTERILESLNKKLALPEASITRLRELTNGTVSPSKQEKCCGY